MKINLWLFYKRILPILPLLILSSCGYQTGSGHLWQSCQTLSIPFIEGDNDGLFTSILVKEVVAESPIHYMTSNGELRLIVTIKDTKSDSVGYMQEVPQNGYQNDTIVASEDRLRMLVEVKVIDSAGTIKLGPVYFSEFVDYDFQPDTTNINYEQFSLGQLDYSGPAKEAAKRPLYGLLAKKITNYLNAVW